MVLGRDLEIQLYTYAGIVKKIKSSLTRCPFQMHKRCIFVDMETNLK